MIWVLVTFIGAVGVLATATFLYTLGWTLLGFARPRYVQHDAGVWVRCWACHHLRPDRSPCPCRVN